MDSITSDCYYTAQKNLDIFASVGIVSNVGGMWLPRRINDPVE